MHRVAQMSLDNYPTNRRVAGAYYTPITIVQFMIARIFYWLEQTGKIVTSNGKALCQSLSEIRFCDPAIGTGNFAVGLIDYMRNRLRRYSDIDNNYKNQFLVSFFKNNFFGVDLFAGSIETCKKRIVKDLPSISISSLQNIKVGNSLVETDVFHLFKEEDAKKLLPFSWQKEFGRKFDVVLGNPPYYNIRKVLLANDQAEVLVDYLKRSKYWRKYFRTSSDIYYYFIIKGLNLLNRGGILSFILPSYWLYNHYADRLRKKLIQYDILELFDFKKLKVFKEDGQLLNISSCILTVQKGAKRRETLVHTIDKGVTLQNLETGVSLKHFNMFSLPQKLFTEKRWVLSKSWQALQELLNNSNIQKLSERAKIFQGMSPGAKEVFVISQDHVKEYELEPKVLRPYVSNKYVQRWTVKRSDLFIIIPKLVSSLEEVPNTKRYLKKHRQRLLQGSDRQKLISKDKIKWYDFNVYRNFSVFKNPTPKILCPYRAIQTRFGYDEVGYACTTDVYAIVPNDASELFFLLGVLNSSILNFWYSEMGKRKGEMLEFFSLALRELPIPIRPKDEKISAISKEIMLKVRDNKQSEVKKLQKSLDEEVMELYQLKI